MSHADQEGSASPAIDAEASATAAVISRLRSRLHHQQILEHPVVMHELRKLEEQIAAQLEHARSSRGRHSAVATKTSPHISDVDGFDLKPDPLTTTTPAEFIETLRQYKAWSGDPSWRRMAQRAGQAVVHSTMYAAMNSETLPKLEVVKAIIIGCGGGEEDLRVYTTAWRQIMNRAIRDRRS